MYQNLKKLSIKQSKLETLSIPTLAGFDMIAIADILYLEADNSYTTFHFLDGKSVVATKNLGYYDDEFSEEAFLRIHQSFMVNLNKVKSYLKADNGYVILINGKPIKVSKSRKEELLVFFKMRRIQNAIPKRITTE